jgi:hypothetical protein
MKLPIILLAALALAGCMGPEGNPSDQPYADEGMIAFKPEPAPATTYDPNVTPPPFNDMQIGQPALNPPPSPVPVYRPPVR